MSGSLLNRYAQLVVQRRWTVLVLMLLVSIGLSSQLGVLQVNNDPDLWAPQNHEFTRTTHELQRVFGGRNFTVIGIFPRQGDIYDPRVLTKIRAIQQGISALPEAIKRNVVSIGARRVKDIAGDAEGMRVRDMLEPMPVTPEQLHELAQALERNPVYMNALVSRDGKAAAIIADFRVAGAQAAYAPLYQKILAVVEPQRDASIDILLGGQPVQAAHLELAMQKMPLYFGIALLIILAVQYLAFRTLQGMLLPLVSALLTVLWALSVMAVLGIHMDALNSTTPILIMAVATGHAVQILKRYYEELARLCASEPTAQPRELSQAAVSQSLQQIAPVMLTAGLIAAIAFFSLLVSDVEMIRNFGVFAGSGVLAALIIELTLIPALRAILPLKSLPKPRGEDALDRVLARIGVLLTQPATAKALLGVALGALVLVSAGSVRVIADNSFKQYFLPDSKVRREDARLNSAFGGTDSIAFLVQGEGEDSVKDARVLAAMAKLQRFLEAQPYVGKTQSIADLIRRMNRAMHGDDAQYDVIPRDSNLIAQYLLLYSSSGDPQDFDNLVDNGYQRAVIWAYLKTDSTTYARELYEKCKVLIAAEFPPGVSVGLGGGLPQTVAANEALVRTKAFNVLQMAVVVFVLASLVFRSPLGGLLVVVPLGAIVLMNLGLMGWLGVPLDMGTASITAMVTGIGADYEIYMLFRLREEYRRRGDLNRALQASLLTSGKAVLFVALSIAGGYAALLISDFQFYPRLGSTMMVTMAISAVMSLLLLRASITLIRPRFIIGGAVATGSVITAASTT